MSTAEAGARTSRPRRRWLAPEVIQSSAMDCGPAALCCLLRGFGIAASYDRLREACQTDVDGTSIDTLADVARQLGLDAEQVMVPVDHVLSSAARALPALVVVNTAQGFTHFVVVWRTAGPWVQVMDPAAGRRWISRHAFLAQLFVHELAVPAAAWRAWAGSDEALAVLRARLRALGIGGSCERAHLETALADTSWRGLARLEAATRRVAALVTRGGLRRGKLAAIVLDRLLATTPTGPEPTDPYASARAIPRQEPGEPILLRGAVLILVRGRLAPAMASDTASDAASGTASDGALGTLSPELTAALARPRVGLGRELLALLDRQGRRATAVLALALVAGGAAVLLEALLFRGLLDLSASLAQPEARLAVLGLSLGLLIGLLLIDLPAHALALALGRRLELGLRTRFLERLLALPDRYLRSRLSSDMAERSHSTHKLRELPGLAANALRWGSQAVFTSFALVWLAPGSWPWIAAALAFAIALPLAIRPLLSERDLRLREHGGALSRFYLDSLLGLVPARNHGAERPLRREHEGLLAEWTRSLLRRERAKISVDFLQAGFGYALAVGLVLRHLAAGGGTTEVLLLVYWSLQMQQLGQQLLLAAEQWPQFTNVARRLLEPLAATAEGDAETPAVSPSAGAASIHCEHVSVLLGGRTVLAELTLTIPPGAHVAIVGASGAGKSTLLGLLLGWVRPSHGRLLVDGRELDTAGLTALRAATAWLDPAVALWNRSLLDNVLFGGSSPSERELGECLDRAAVRPLLESLPEGLQTPLGEGGALVSGGEGQRIRLARALLRRDARLVLFDEPFRGLDRTLRRRLLVTARRRWSASTLLCVTHDVADSLDFDQVLVLREGRLREAGPPSELAARPGSLYRTLLDAGDHLERRLSDRRVWRHCRLHDGQLEQSDTGPPPSHRPATPSSGASAIESAGLLR